MELKKLIELLCGRLEYEMNYRVIGLYPNHVDFKIETIKIPLPGSGSSRKFNYEIRCFTEIKINNETIYCDTYILAEEDNIDEIEDMIMKKLLSAVFNTGLMEFKHRIDTIKPNE